MRCSGVVEASNANTAQTTTIRTKIKAHGAKVLLSQSVRSSASNSYTRCICMFIFLLTDNVKSMSAMGSSLHGDAARRMPIDNVPQPNTQQPPALWSPSWELSPWSPARDITIPLPTLCAGSPTIAHIFFGLQGVNSTTPTCMSRAVPLQPGRRGTNRDRSQRLALTHTYSHRCAEFLCRAVSTAMDCLRSTVNAAYVGERNQLGTAWR